MSESGIDPRKLPPPKAPLPVPHLGAQSTPPEARKRLDDIGCAGLRPEVRRFAVIGTVSVGKTTLFGRLCAGDAHAQDIAGSTPSANQGVLVVGPGAAPRLFRSRCPRCASRRGSLPWWPRVASPCVESSAGLGDADCPALKGRGGWFGRSRTPMAPTGERPRLTHLYDTPGSAVLGGGSEDEMVARDLLLSGQISGILFVADAKNLRRSLALVLEVAQFGLPMVLAVNMLDEAESAGVEVELDVLSHQLGVPCCGTVGVEGRGVHRLGELLLDPRPVHLEAHLPADITAALAKLTQLLANPVVSPRGVGLLLLQEDRDAQRWVDEHLGDSVLAAANRVVAKARAQHTTPLPVLISDAFHEHAEQLANRARRTTGKPPQILTRLGEMAQRPWPGIPIAACVLLLAYYWVGIFGATFVVDRLALAFERWVLPPATAVVGLLPFPLLRDAILDPDFGLLSTGVFLALGLVLPVLVCFYVLQAILEDMGYLPRLAVLSDRVLAKFGLNGHGLIPLVLGFSCVTMAIITTRLMSSRKEKIILSLILVGLPCAPLLAVMMIILGKLPWTATALIVGVIALRFAVAGVVTSRVLPGERSDLILEIPQMRLPRLRVLWAKTWRRTWHFMREAVPVFMAASLLVFAFDRIGGLAVVEHWGQPFVRGVLGLPDDAVRVFIKTAIRRESGAAELNLLFGSFTNLQLVVSLLVMTFVMPCLNALIVLIKERGVRAAFAVLALTVSWAVLAGAVVNFACTGLGLTFS